MGLRDLFGREPDDINAQLMREADAERRERKRKGGAASAEDFLERVMAEIQAGRKIAAIKIYREATGVGLAEAKDAVEAIEAGRAPQDSAPPRPRDFAATDSRVQELIALGRTIEAIKVYREITGVGLKEARDAVIAMSPADER